MFTIVIQAGGKSSRMGQDKALMPFLGRPLVERMVERLRPLAQELLVTTNRPEDYAFLGLPLIEDSIPGVGALGGLFTALSAASHPLAAVVACDMPFISAELLAVQRGLLLHEGADLVIPRSPFGLEPLHAVYQCGACLPVVRAALDAGERRMAGWISQVNARVMEPEEIMPVDPQFRSFMNVNSPDEFQQAEALARLIAGGG